jgi:competence protein ComEC
MKTIRWFLLPLLATFLWVPGLGTQEPPPLRVHFVDVGQGDGILIQSPSGQNVVIDAGEDPDRMRDYLTGLAIERVDLAIASHNHADHIGGLRAVLQRFTPRFYLENGVPTSTLTYHRTLQAVQDAGSQLIEPAQRRIDLGGAALTVILPPGIADWDQNDNSLGLIVEYGDFRLSLAGDAEPREWSWWLVNYPDVWPKVTVHKASHHGSLNGDTAQALAKLSPERVIISVGQGNTYGHPDAQALQLYARANATVHRTDKTGTIIIEARQDGSYTVHVERGEGAQPPPATPSPAASPSPTPNPSPLPRHLPFQRHHRARLHHPLRLPESG